MNAAAVGLILVVAAGLFDTVRDDLPSVAIAAVVLAVLVQGRVGAPWLILGGAAIGLARLVLGVP